MLRERTIATQNCPLRELEKAGFSPPPRLPGSDPRGSLPGIGEKAVDNWKIAWMWEKAGRILMDLCASKHRPDPIPNPGDKRSSGSQAPRITDDISPLTGPQFSISKMG